MRGRGTHYTVLTHPLSRTHCCVYTRAPHALQTDTPGCHRVWLRAANDRFIYALYARRSLGLLAPTEEQLRVSCEFPWQLFLNVVYLSCALCGVCQTLSAWSRVLRAARIDDVVICADAVYFLQHIASSSAFFLNFRVAV